LLALRRRVTISIDDCIPSGGTQADETAAAETGSAAVFKAICAPSPNDASQCDATGDQGKDLKLPCSDVTRVTESIEKRISWLEANLSNGAPKVELDKAAIAKTIQVSIEKTIPLSLSKFAPHILEQCRAMIEEQAQMPASVDSSIGSEAVSVAAAPDRFIKQYVQMQCCSKNEFNGNLGFVLGSLDGGRYAVFVPGCMQRISIKPDKLRLLSFAEATKYFGLPGFWQQSFHSLVFQEQQIYEAEKHKSQGVPPHQG